MYQRAGSTSDITCNTSGMLSMGKIIPESIMVGIIKINPEANMAATCVRVTEEISKPNANDTNINNSDTTINQNRLPATGTCNT